MVMKTGSLMPPNVTRSLREVLDELDNQIAWLLRTRISIARSIVRDKRENGIEITDDDRERWIIDRVQMIAELTERESIARIYGAIFDEAKRDVPRETTVSGTES